MTIFELVKLALDELYEEGKAEYGSKLDAIITKRIEYLSESYRQLGSEEREPINYKDPATRFAYVFNYFASHGDYLVQTLQAARSALCGDLFKTTSLPACPALEGGPAATSSPC